MVWGLLGFLGWGSLYKHERINLEEMVLSQYVVSSSNIFSGSEHSDESSSQETTTIPTPSPAAEVSTTEDSHSTHSVCGVSGMYLV